jgi:hypothetical protein
MTPSQCPHPQTITSEPSIFFNSSTIVSLGATTVSNSIDFFPFPKIPGVTTPLRRVIALSFCCCTRTYVELQRGHNCHLPAALPFGCINSGHRLLLPLHSINCDCPIKAATRHSCCQSPSLPLAIVRPFAAETLPRCRQHAAEMLLNLQRCHGIYIEKKGHEEDP